jgi:hypothetical protein
MEYDDIPNDFRGLLFEPYQENAVYVLVGLLAQFVPLPIVFESFESDPIKEAYTHGKWIDATGRLLEEGAWKRVAIEFKCRSSGLLRDLKKHQGLRCDVVICWEHDSPEVDQYVAEVVELKPIYWRLPAEQRRKVILWPDYNPKQPVDSASIDRVIAAFSEDGRIHINGILEVWRYVVVGHGKQPELHFRCGSYTAIRVYRYRNEFMLVKERFAGAIPRTLVERCEASPNSEGLRFSLARISNDDVREVATRVLAASRGLAEFGSAV